MGHQKLVQEVAFRAHDLDAIIPRCTGTGGGCDHIADLLFNSVFVQFDWRKRADGRFDWRGADAAFAVGVATCVQDLVERDINTARYRNTGSQQEYASFDAWCYFMYPDIAGPNNPDRGWNASEPVEPDWRYLFRQSPCVRCQQALELCQALEAVDVVVDGVPGPPQFRTHGDKDAAVEIDLGCFGPESESAVEDQCCDDALDDQPAPTVRGKCPRSLERCVRPANNFLCAKDDDRDGLCSDRATSEWPLCAPRGLV